MSTILNLLRIGPAEVYNFSEDELLLIKLTHNINLALINNTNPFLFNKDKQTHNQFIVGILSQFISNKLLTYNEVDLFLTELNTCYLNNGIDQVGSDIVSIQIELWATFVF